MSIASVNLISPRRAAAAHRRELTRRWGKGLGFYALVLGVLGVALHGTSSRQQELRDAVGQLEAKVDARRASLAGERTRLDGLRKSLRAAQAVGAHPDWGRVLTSAALGAGEDVTIERIELDVKRSEPAPQAARGQKRAAHDRLTTRTATIVVVGIATSTTAAQQYSVRLEDLRFFDQVRMTETTQAGAGESVRFEIRCTVTDDAASTTTGGRP